MKNNKLALCVLAKYPSVGNVKIRLAKDIDPNKAVDLYYKLLINTIHQVDLTKIPHDTFVVSSDFENKYLLESMFLGKFNVIFYKEKSLGILIRDIFYDFIIKKGYSKTLVICSDSPFIEPGLILEAYNALEKRNTLFISPSSDGGYSLVGLNKFVDVFSSIIMSTSKVLEETLEAAKSFRLSIYTSSTVDDIDTIEDIYKLREKINNHHDPSGVVRKELNSII